MVYCHQHPVSPPRVFVFHKKLLCLWKTVQILFTFPCRYAVCIPVFAHKLPLFTQSLSEFPAISCLVHPQFIFILHDRIYRGPLLPPPTGGIVMHETQQPRDPKKTTGIVYAVILVVLLLLNFWAFPAMMKGQVKQVDYGTFLNMLEGGELSTVEIQDQQIYFVDKTIPPTAPTPLRRTCSWSTGWKAPAFPLARCTTRPPGWIPCWAGSSRCCP